MAQLSQNHDWYWRGQLFSPPKTSPGMIGRDREKSIIAEFLASDKAALHIVGFGGTGKSYLAGWLAWHGRDDRVIAWVDCGQQSVNVEGLVASIGAATNNDYILDRLRRQHMELLAGDSPPLRDAIYHCIDEFNQSRCILILEDFHDLDESLSALLEYRFLRPLMQGLQGGKIVIVSRRFPAIWDDPDIRSGQEHIQLTGLTREETKSLLADRSIDLPQEQFEILWQKTKGIPKAIAPLVERLRSANSFEKAIADWPIYTATGDWIGSQIQTLSSRTKDFLFKMSVLRRPEKTSLCQRIWIGEDFDRRASELRRRCLLDPLGDEDTILVSNLFREYMLEHELTRSERVEMHDQTAKAYLAEAYQTRGDGENLLVEAIWHASNAKNPELVVRAAIELRRKSLPLKDRLDLLGQCDTLIVEAARQTNENSILLYWLPLLSYRLSIREELSQAVMALDEAARIAKSHGSKIEQFEIIKQMASALYAQRKHAHALAAYSECLQIAQSLGNLELELQILPEMGGAQLRNNQTTEAEETLKRCIGLAQRQRNPLVEGKAASKLARLYLKHTDITARGLSLEWFQKAERLAVEVNDRHTLAEVYGLLGDYYRYEKNLELAHRYYERSRRIVQELGSRAQEVVTIGQMAWLAREMGEYERSLDLSRQAEQLSKRLGNVVGQQISMILSAENLLTLERLEEAYGFIEAALRICQDPEQRQPIGIASANRALAKYYKATGEMESAKDSIDRALAGFIEQNSYQYAKETWEVAKPIYHAWADRSDLATLREAFDWLESNDTEAFRLERMILLARLMLGKLADMPDPSDQLGEICDTMTALHVSRTDWGASVVRFCLDQWSVLAPSVFLRVMPWADQEEQKQLCAYWIESAIYRHSLDAFRSITTFILRQEQWPFEARFTLIDPLEAEIVEHIEAKGLKGELANAYVTHLVSEIDRCIRLQQPLPSYADDLRRALYYLDPKQFDFIDYYIRESIEDARKRALVETEFTLVPEPVRLDLRGKRITLIGGNERVRRQVEQLVYDQFSLEDLREVAPSWEQRVDKEKVKYAVNGADLIVVVWKQMKHDMKDALDTCLDKKQKQLVRYPLGHGTSSIIRVIHDFFATDVASVRSNTVSH